jgi:mono/diheme cytochrome c family protein
VLCHGTSGDGKGEMAASLSPRPRDFQKGIFKYRSTPSGTLPTDADLQRTIREGVPGTAMPIFAALSEREIRAVAAYVKTFSSRWRKAQFYSAPLEIPAVPDWFHRPEALTQQADAGSKLFAQLCSPCHGPDGSGRGGERSLGLQDENGEASAPADLRRPYIRSGRELRDIFKALSTGLDGTPMASFQETLTEEQRWQLVAFILKLRNPGAPGGEK